MARYVAFLRAVNVAGHAAVRMEDLKGAFSAAGCREVQSYIQSGNIIYEAPASGRAALEKRLAARVGPLVGGEATIISRAMRQLETLVATDPFQDLKGGAQVKCYVAFLGRKPGARPALPVRDPRERVEIRTVIGRDAIVITRRKPNGFYGFPNALVEKALASPATSRNWNTIMRIVNKFGEG